ncbi:hypothetical protein QF000_006979 [Paraburkholderia atlantica]
MRNKARTEGGCQPNGPAPAVAEATPQLASIQIANAWSSFP